MNRNTSRILVFGALAIAVNVVLGIVVAGLKIPLLFLDTMGTIFMAACFGPLWGIAVAIGTHLLMGILYGFTAFPFVLVSIATAIVVGLMARNGKFGLKKAIVTGLILAAVSPLIGTPIRMILFGGFTGSGADFMIAAMRAAGAEIFTSTFIGVVVSNFVDKIISCVLVSLVLSKIPARTLGINNRHAQ